MWSRLGRCALLAIVLVASLAWMPQARAQQSAPFPSNPLPSNAELNYLVEGEIDSEIADEAHLIFERFDLKSGESLPTESGAQILIAVSGSVTTTDDLGLTASLNAGDRLFAPAGTINELTAASDARILRARIGTAAADTTEDEPPPAAILHEIEIFTARCDPASITVRPGDSLAITNSTDRRQFFTVEEIDLEVRIEAGETTEVSLEDLPSGSWVADCGRSSGGGAIDTVTLNVEKPENSQSANTTSGDTHTVAEPTILLDAPLDTDQSIPTHLFVAKLTLGGKATTGEQTFTGPTAVIATSQPLTIQRENRLGSSLPANTGVLFPTESTATFVNAANTPTEVFFVGLKGSADGNANDDDDRSSTDRTTSRGSSAEEEPSPTPRATARPSTRETNSDLESRLPSNAALAELGYTWFSTEETTGFADSLYSEIDDSTVRAAWREGITASYIGGGNVLLIAVDEFSTSASASDVLDTMQLGLLFSGSMTPITDTGNADQVVAGEAPEGTSEEFNLAIVFARYGNIVISVVLGVDVNDDSMGPTLEVWEVVDAAQN